MEQNSTPHLPVQEDYSLVGLEEGETDDSPIHQGENSPLLGADDAPGAPREQFLSIIGQTFLLPTNHVERSSHKPQYTRITPAYRKHRYEHRKQVFACFLASFSAFADVLCYHSFGCYGNMMTGNTIRLMDHLAAGRWPEAAYPALLVPAYILGAGFCTWLNKLDLSFLRLGGPSQEAFSHLNPPRRLRSREQITVLRVVAIVAVGLFVLGEAFGVLICRSSTSRWRLPFFSAAFGLINAATLAAIHVVTNAVTGHWITVGLGVADDLPILLNRQSSTNGGAAYYAPEEIQPPQRESQKRWKSSMLVAASFIGSIIVCSLVYNECLREVENHPDWPLAIIFRFAPPMGVVFSVLYTVLLYWYTLPPPFLQGFSSRDDLSLQQA